MKGFFYVFSVIISTGCYASIVHTQVDGMAPTATTHILAANTAVTYYAAPDANQPAHAKLNGDPDNPGTSMYAGHETVISSTTGVNIKLGTSSTTTDPDTGLPLLGGRFDVSLAGDVTSPFTITFDYNRTIGSFTNLQESAMTVRQAFDNSFSYGLDVSMLSSTLNTAFEGIAPFGIGAPSGLQLWQTTNVRGRFFDVGNATQVTGTGRFDAYDGSNDVAMTMVDTADSGEGFGITSLITGASPLQPGGWSYTFDPGAGNTFASGTTWYFTFNGGIEPIPEPSISLLSVFSLVSLLIRRRR